jgi:enoyl-CoA hydratase
MSGKEIIFEKAGAVATIIFNRPEVHNALNSAMVDGLERALNTVQADQSIRCVILTGAGEKSFLSGSDISELSKRTPLTGIDISLKRQALFSRLEGLPIPSIAAINGYALGVGCEIAIACTLRLASERAKFGQPEINLGIIPGGGGTQRLPRLVGKARALELVLTGKIIDASEAYRIGLVNKVVAPDKLIDECLDWAMTISEKSPIAMKYALRAINEGMEVNLTAGQTIEGLCIGACFASEDSKEGLNAFLEKRKAHFKGI